jgi:hypothetical protein
MTASVARDTAVRAKGPIGTLGGWWMGTPESDAATEAAGMAGWQLYFLGRHGVVGDADPDVITAVAYFFPPDVVRKDWEAARRVMTPHQAVQAYAEVLHQWGRDTLDGFAGARELIELSRRVVDHVDVAGLPLFAGWRALPEPAGLGACLAHCLQLLREHRGSCHGVGVRASGLAPLTAVLANEGGVVNAEDYGWRPPFPTVSDEDRSRWDRAEAVTDDLAAQGYGALDEAESRRFLELLDDAYRHVFPDGPPHRDPGEPAGS